MKYDKLVRDNILEIIRSSGKVCEYRQASGDKEYEDYLRRKLTEEINEFFASPDEREMADILEVLDAVMELYSIDRYVVETEQKMKREFNGAFEKRTILLEVTE
jgi:predicted house-cleaning noncanonical NTP pyrophosphatase (MazG superfamily)